MDNNINRYTKGEREDVIRRFNNVHTITLYCPSQDESSKIFKMCLVSNLNGYLNKDSNFELVPVIDVFNCFMTSLNCCKDENISSDILYSIWGIIQSFNYLKYINIIFTDDKKVLSSYNKIRGKDKSDIFEVVKSIYSVDVLEFVLSNMFTQEIIDILNKTFVFDEIITNDYLLREFIIMFKYDDYISFMDMITNNNASTFDQLDPNIVDYLRIFPKIIARDKPTIRVITNYDII